VPPLTPTSERERERKVKKDQQDNREREIQQAKRDVTKPREIL
jgi:hypothetical protein